VMPRAHIRAWMLVAVLGATIMPGKGRATSPGATSIPVPAVTIMQGDVLAEDLIDEQPVVASARALKHYFTSRQAVVGKVARRVLLKGHAIPISSVREAYLFKEGERVALVFRDGGLSIEASGVALQPGVLGSPVNVRNSETGVIVRGVVQSNGSVQVGEN
jgi:flagella basal body P-ring formation protein FlgA